MYNGTAIKGQCTPSEFPLELYNKIGGRMKCHFK